MSRCDFEIEVTCLVTSQFPIPNIHRFVAMRLPLQCTSTDGHLDLLGATVQILIPDLIFAVRAMLNLGAGNYKLEFFLVAMAGHASYNDVARIPQQYKEGETTTGLFCSCELHRPPYFILCHRASKFATVISRATRHTTVFIDKSASDLKSFPFILMATMTQDVHVYTRDTHVKKREKECTHVPCT